VFGFPSVVRFSWATTAKLLKDQGTLVDWYVNVILMTMHGDDVDDA
jgi:hypothetical protein